MSAIETALLKVDTAVANVTGTTWLRNRKTAVERRLSLTELVGARGSGLVPQRRLSHQFEQLAGTIADQLQPLTAVEIRDLEDNERLAEVARSLEKPDLSDGRVLGTSLSSAAIGRLSHRHVVS